MRKSTRAAVVGGTVLALGGAGIAFAAWTTDGTGSAAATATTAQNLVVSSTGVTGLYPTGSFDVPYSVQNNNPYDVKLSSITMGTTITVDSAHAANCSVSGISGPAKTVTDVVTKNGGTVSSTFPISVSNQIDNGCQGATFTLSLTAHGLSN